MRSNAMKTCAVGAMLFGGTLGMSQAASAGLTWTGQGVGDFSSVDSDRTLVVGNSLTTSGVAADAYGSAAFSATTFSATGDDAPFYPGASVSFSGLTPSGENANSWSTSAIVPGATPGYNLVASFNMFYLFFTVTGNQQVTIKTAAGLEAGSYWNILVAGAGDPEYSFEAGLSGSANSQTFTLTAGDYYVSANATAGAGFSGDMMNFTVPAPGAAALVGLAGLMTRRRKA
jgi:hypothetical protein